MTHRNMKVLCCQTGVAPTGGIASAGRSAIRAFNSFGAEVKAIAYHGPTGILNQGYLQSPSHFEITECDSSRARLISTFASLSLRWKPDLVFVDHIHLAPLAFLMGRLTGIPYVLFCHGIEMDRNVTSLRLKAFGKASLRLANSHFTASRLSSRYAPVEVVPTELALDEIAFSEGPKGSDLPVEPIKDAFGNVQPLSARTILIVGRLASDERYKGHDILISAMKKIVAKIPSAQLIIAGTGDDSDRLKEFARSQEVGKQVLFTGYVASDRLNALYRACRVFAMPSQHEGFGLVYLEAMRNAKACLASKTDAGRELIRDGVNGVLVDPINLNEIASSLIKLLLRKELAVQLGKNGLKILNQHYRHEHFEERFAAALQQAFPNLKFQRKTERVQRRARG